MRLSFWTTAIGLAWLACSSVAAAEEQPRVPVLTPGFRVRELPVRLTNINGLAFSPDGRLYAAGYDGRIHRLVDTDGDGLEDRAEPFWDRRTLITPIGIVWSPEGLYVSSNAKVSLLRDTDGDGKADREEVVAKGWPPIAKMGGNVDAMGLARDPLGNLYFGLGCEDYANAYLLKDGRANYDLKSERGAILKLSADRKTREIVATGLRFPYALKFNRRGDLFATDQEGETWLPGGNPLDEMDHIQTGRHYGFPPRHEKHLPNVRDEPPVVGFGPQHQSACGLVFDEEVDGLKRFGPEDWEGDAFVSGSSRGKIWRVRLIKTTNGYVGKPTLFASPGMMAVDLAISPTGSLYLSCHSGSPDWGSGPNGMGRLFQIRYEDPDAPQPVAAWPAGPLEVRVAFDRPIDESAVKGLAGQTIPFGAHVRAADRLEAHKPSYKAVTRQLADPKGSLRIAAASLTEDGRTVVLATDPHPREATYALTLPSIRARGKEVAGPATVDLAYDLSGVEATWDDGKADAKPAWSGWWPHIDPEIVRALTRGSLEHERAIASLARPGRLTLRGLVALPKGKATLRLSASGPFEATVGSESAESTVHAKAPEDERHQASLTQESTGEAVFLEVKFRTGDGGKSLAVHASLHTDNDPTERPVPTTRLTLPWAPASPPPPANAPASPPAALAGGDPKRGESVYFSDEAKCSTCHTIRGKGGNVGPDLSNLIERDAASVYRDIAEPSATIHPDFVPYTVALKNGQVAAGIVRAEGADSIKVVDASAKATLVKRDEIEELRPSSTSIMPVGLVGAIGEAKVRDLIAFLLAAPPEKAKSK